ncbi:MAG: tripartite tricarboxylate transporter substrate binding protein [Burkholderiales bacterium]
MKYRHALAVCCTLIAAGAGAAALDYPVRTVRVIVPGPPGGGADILARAVTQKMAENLGQPFVVDNRAGASGIIGTELTAHAAPDGYTIMIGHSGTHAINLSLRKTLPYHPVKDFTPLMLVANVPNVLITHPGLPARSVKQLIAFAKSRPGQMTYASAGTGFSQHLAGVLFCDMAGVKMLHVPYKGSAPGMTDVIAGNVMLMFPNVTAALPHIRNGRLRALGVTSPKRSAVLPGVPAIAETLPGYEATAWFGFFAPARLPPELTAFLNSEMVRALTDPRVRQLIQSQGADVVGDTPEAFLAFVSAEIAKWAKVIKAAGVEQE